MRTHFAFYPALLLSLLIGMGLKIDLSNPLIDKFPHRISNNSSNQTAEITPIEEVETMIGEVNQERILTDLRKLTGEEDICRGPDCYRVKNRYTGSVDLQWAKDYILGELLGLGYSVDVFNWSLAGYADQDFIVKKTGVVTPENEIYFVAHMDGVINSPGADDDASGVVSLLELARILDTHEMSSTVVMLFSSGEEQGTLGVSSYVDQLTQEQLDAISYVVNVDMIGYDANTDGIMELWNGDQPLDFVQLLTDIVSAYQTGLTPEIVSDCG